MPLPDPKSLEPEPDRVTVRELTPCDCAWDPEYKCGCQLTA